MLEAQHTSVHALVDLSKNVLDARSDNRERVPGVKTFPADAFWSIHELPLPVYHLEYATNEPWM